VDFNTGALVVDIMAGEHQLGEVLLLDQFGNVTVHNDADDPATYKKFTDAQKAPAGPVEGRDGMMGRPPAGAAGGGGLDDFGREPARPPRAPGRTVAPR
jgi:hypothetical protein